MMPDRLLYFLEHFWIDQQCDQIWTLGARIYHQNIANDTINSWGHLWKTWFSCLRFWNSENIGRYVYRYFSFYCASFYMFMVRFSCYLMRFRCFLFLFFEILSTSFLLNIVKMRIGQWYKLVYWNLENLGYEIHIDQKHEMGIW